MRAVIIVIRTWRNQLHGVRPEQGQFPDVLLPHGNRPAIVGIRLRSVAQLMPPNRDLWSRRHRQPVRNLEPLPRHSGLPQKVPCAKHHATVIIARDNHAAPVHRDGEALRRTRPPSDRKPRTTCGIASQPQLRALLHFLGKHLSSLLFDGGCIRT